MIKNQGDDGNKEYHAKIEGFCGTVYRSKDAENHPNPFVTGALPPTGMEWQDGKTVSTLRFI